MKIKIVFTARFVRQYKKLPKELQQEAKEKMQLFQSDPEHPFLKTHKLKGILKGFWSFSVNYKHRIVFQYDSKTTAAFLKIGDHDIYQ